MKITKDKEMRGEGQIKEKHLLCLMSQVINSPSNTNWKPVPTSSSREHEDQRNVNKIQLQ